MFFACKSEPKKSEIEAVLWKYESGSSIGDFISFKATSVYSIDENFIIYKKQKKIAEVISCDGNELEIQLLNSEEKGYYNKIK